MTRDEYSPSKTRSMASTDCEKLESLLTTAFDGEANAEALGVARAHCQSCAPCAALWRSWESTRILLKTAPVPTEPRSLLTRALLACRLCAFEKTGAALSPAEYSPAESAQAECAQAGYSRDVLMLEELLFDPNFDDANRLQPPLRKFFAEIAPPSDLQAEIIRRTVNAKKEKSQWLESLGAFFAPRPLRWAGALAVPALAAWLLIVSLSPTSVETETPAHVVEQVPSTPAPPRVSSSNTLDRITQFLPNILPDVKVRAEAKKPVASAASRVASAGSAAESQPPFVAVRVRKEASGNGGIRGERINGRSPVRLNDSDEAEKTPPSPAPQIHRVKVTTPARLVRRIAPHPVRPRRTASRAAEPKLATTRLTRPGLQVTTLAATPRFDEAEAYEFGRDFAAYRESILAGTLDVEAEDAEDDELADDDML